MGIINRDLDPSQKKVVLDKNFGAIATGVTNLLGIVPFNAFLQGVNLAPFGVSGSPVYSLSVFRGVVGGLTSVSLGVSLAASTLGASGPIGATISGIGATLLRGDVLCLTSGGANSAVATANVSVTISGSNDYNKYAPNTVG
jgi:hypothetical protein